MLISFEFLDLLKVVCNGKSSFLASADDSGDVKVHSIVVFDTYRLHKHEFLWDFSRFDKFARTQIIDIGQKCLYKTLRAGHTSVSLLPCVYVIL